MMAEAERGPGRPTVDSEVKKVPFSASIRTSVSQMVDYLVSTTGEPKGALVERLVEAQYREAVRHALVGQAEFVNFLCAHGYNNVHVAAELVALGDQLATGFDADGLVVHATERALFALSKAEDKGRALEAAAHSLIQMQRFHTRLARFDLINGVLNFGTPQSVAHAIELSIGKPVYLWIVGEHNPYIGVLHDKGEYLYLAPVEGSPLRNGTGLIPKLNVVSIERTDIADKLRQV